MDLLNMGVEVLWIARYDYTTSSVQEAHSHEYFQLTYVFSGEGDFLLGDYRFQLSRQSLLFIPPGLIHNIDLISQTVKTYNIKFHITDQGFRNKTCLIPFVVTPPLSFLDHFTEIHNYGMVKPPYYKEKCQLKMADLIIDLLTLEENKAVSGVTGKQPGQKICSQMQSVLDYLYANYNTAICAQTLEEESGCSYRYLSSLFKDELGIAPIAFLEKLRIEKAKDLIRLSDYELKRIAEIVGFHSVHYFTSVFKKQVGLPPGEWRKREISGIGKDIILEENFINRMHIRPPGND